MHSSSIKYVYSEDLIAESNKNPAVPSRAEMVHELIRSYGLLNNMHILRPKICKPSDLRGFHSSDYIEFLMKRSNLDESDSEDPEFGLGFDCPVWLGIMNYATSIAGSTLTGCNELSKGQADVVLNWNGGWHHAHRDKAAGYCYVNDIVLGILLLRNTFQRILYIDLDIHHGDGVQEAFETTKKVFTLSFHQYECGFFPGTGDSNDCGFAGGKGYSANFPYKSGVTGENFTKYFKRVTDRIVKSYQPQVCVVQCGADVIAGDPLGSSNLYPHDMLKCIRLIQKLNLPTMFLGGGGYNFPNASRYWAQITASVCGLELYDDIPDSDKFFLSYGPDYSIQVSERRRPDANSEEYLEKCAKVIENNIEAYVSCI